ncbi:uncharacterized protein [Watersipora subatra]|uniref:uncharacterized protein n=1 Tax=Watersipora subatra TaxID=2589382 RepID=UPI00355B87C6
MWTATELYAHVTDCRQGFSRVEQLDFLSGRTQRVVVEEEESAEAAVTSGVSQGSVIGPTRFIYYINNLPDSLSTQCRLFADDTIWHSHIKGTANKANFTLSFIRHKILTTSEKVKVTAYKQLVLPLLEYASASWDPTPNSASDKLEAVQRRVVRLICGVTRSDKKTSTTNLLQRLQQLPLSERRSERRLKIFSQYHHSNSVVLDRYVKRSSFRSSRRHLHQYFIPQFNTLHHQRLFFIRTARAWNLLPSNSNLLVAA